MLYHSITRLKDLIINAIGTDTVESLTGLKGKTDGALSTSCAEEIDFLSLNEWMKPRDDGQPVEII